MRSEVVDVVRELAKEHRTRFRASFVAERAGLPVDVARRDLVRLAAAGVVLMNFELLCPDDDRTVATFHERDQIPATYSSDDCDDGEAFEVTPELIWVTFTPTDQLQAEVAQEHARVQGEAQPPAGEGAPPGKRRSQRAAPKGTRSRSTSARQMLH